MPSSVSEGTRPSASRMRPYSSAVMLCEASNCGVTRTGSGTTCAEEAGVITVALIVACHLRRGWRSWPVIERKEDAAGRAGRSGGVPAWRLDRGAASNAYAILWVELWLTH